MKTLYFQCTLLTDVIINQKSASEGAQSTLDFIPGSNFLGVVASKLYKEATNQNFDIFHSGLIRFGDAHLADGNNRSLHIPAVYFYPKMEKISECCYVMPKFSQAERTSDDLRKLQLKQARNGFYVFADNQIKEIKNDKNYAIKSAYDYNERRSADSQMYGYESLQRGAKFFFSIEVDAEQYAESIVKSLEGKHTLGRSRTAQYGLVEIKKIESFNQPQSQPKSSKDDYAFVYADSRLIFIDANGLPTLQPTAEQLGFADGAHVEYEFSQIRTFQYSPYNFKRQAFDTDRVGIEKGSVIAVKLNGTQSPCESAYCGSYRNEGFGHVIYNPDFLKFDSEGKAEYKFVEEKKKEEKNDKAQLKELKHLGICSTNPLISYLVQQNNLAYEQNEIYRLVGDFVDKNAIKFRNKQFASQWGRIRAIAMESTNWIDLHNKLFEEPVRERGIKGGYLMHGIAAEKWEERGRCELLSDFLQNNSTKDFKFLQQLLINLAAEMAKKSK